MELYNENITKKIIGELERFKFVERPNFEKYDYISILNHETYIELVREAYMKENKLKPQLVRQFKKNGISGVFVEC